MKTKSIILIAISLGFGLVAAIGMTQVMGRQKADTANVVEEINVLVAKNDIEIRQVLTADDVMIKSFRPSQVPEGTASSVDDITDKRSTIRVGKGNFISTTHLVEKNMDIHIEIPKGYSVYSVTPSIESTFLNSLRPGDRIDIIGILRNPNNGEQVAKTFLKSISVFAINSQLSREIQQEDVNIQLVQVLLRPRQAEQLALVQSVGKIQFVMRPGDHTAVELNEAQIADDETNGDAVGLGIFFQNEGKDPEQTGALRIEQEIARNSQAAMNAQASMRNRKSFRMTMMGPDGPVQYEWEDRSSMPRKVEDERNNVNEVSAVAPQTYPPSGQPSSAATPKGATKAKSAGSETESEESESSTRADQPESE